MLSSTFPGLGLPAHPRRTPRPGHLGRCLHRLGDPPPSRHRPRTRARQPPWASFLRSQADALIACDFFETVTLTGARLFVLAAIEYASRRIRVLGVTAQPTGSWVVQAARNLVMDLEDAGSRARFLIRDRDGKFPALFDAVLKDAGIAVVLSGIQMPRMNAVMERWVLTCRRELLDRTLIWNQRHLLYALREFEQFYNCHRPHQGIANARPLQALPPPPPPTDVDACLPIHRHGPSRGHPPRIPACRFTSTDVISGRHKVSRHATDRIAAPPHRAFDAGLRPARFQAEPPACCRDSWQLSGPDFHQQATTSLRIRRNAMALRHGVIPSCSARRTRKPQWLWSRVTSRRVSSVRDRTPSLR
jgi:putative transposase